MAVSNAELHNTIEYRKHFLGLLSVQILTVAFIVLLTFTVVGLMSHEIDRRIYNTIALMEDLYPGSAAEIVPLFTGEVSGEVVDEGRKIMGPYGYNRTFFMHKPLVTATIFPIAAFIVFVVMVSVTLNVSVFRKFQQDLFGKLGRLSDCILSILDGKTVYITQKHNEGILDILFFRFNQMVKKLEGTAEMLNREKIFLRDIISDISHQLKTPMSSLIMYNDLMLSDVDMKSRKRYEFLTICSHQLNRMEWLIIGLLKLARLETGSIVFQMTNIDIMGPLENAVKNLDHLKKSRKLTFSDTRKNQYHFKGDPNWLTEAFSNILKNAYEHTDEVTGTVDITLEQTALFLRIMITDNGPGISEVDLPRIFERFYKGGNSVAMESVGIGLPLSKMIFESHGGDIRAEGSTFTITFPY